MKFSVRSCLASSVACILAACGGGGGSSAPPVQAPAPTPSPSPTPDPTPTTNPNPPPLVYLKFDQLVGDRDIPGACQQVEEAGTGRLAAQLDPGPYSQRIARYIDATQTYTVYPPRGTATSFGPTDKELSPPDLIVYRKASSGGGAQQNFTIRTPAGVNPANGPSADYTRFFEFEIDQPAGAPRLRAFCVGGVTTRQNDPASVTANVTYGDFTITGRRYTVGTGASLASFQNIIPGTAQVTLVNQRVTMSIRLDTAAAQYGPFTGTANLDPGTNGFRTVLTDGSGRRLTASGAIFGPGAKEIGINLGTVPGSSTNEVIAAGVVGIAPQGI